MHLFLRGKKKTLNVFYFVYMYLNVFDLYCLCEGTSMYAMHFICVCVSPFHHRTKAIQNAHTFGATPCQYSLSLSKTRLYQVYHNRVSSTVDRKIR